MADGLTGNSIAANRPLTDEEFGLLQHYIDSIMEKIAAENFSLVIETDFSKLFEFLDDVGSPLRNPTFDPDCSDLSRDAFWLRVVDQNGVTVACHAERIFEVDDFHELVASGKLWHRDGMKWGGERVPELEINRIPLDVHGRVTHAGAMWIRPHARKRGLSLYLPYLSRALCLRNYDAAYLSGFVLQGLAGSKVPKMAYGFPHMEPYLRGWFPPTRRHEEVVYLCYQSRVEGVERFRELPEHPQFPIAAPGEKEKEPTPAAAKPAEEGATSDLEVGKRTRVDADH
jgi:hypothetical protein